MEMTPTTNTISTEDRSDVTDPLLSSGAISAWPDLKNILTSESSWRSRLPASPTKSPWPEPELSIGLPCCSFGRHKCWEVVGPARDISQAIFRATKEVLDQHSEFLHETEKVPFSIMFGLYMVGKNEKKSRPTLLLSCEPKIPRRKALKLVRESRILEDFPGVVLAESSQAPTALGHVRPLGGLGAADPDFIFFSPPTLNNVCGRPILVMESNDPENLAVTSVSLKATIGGFVRLRNSESEDVYCGLTVAHAFEDEPKAPHAFKNIEFAFDGSDDEGHDDDDEEMERDSDSCVTQGHFDSKSQPVGQNPGAGRIPQLPVESQIQRESLRTGGHGVGSRIATSLEGEYPDLDWALIEIQQPHSQPANVITIHKITGQIQVYVERIVPVISENENVLVVTSSGVQKGVLSASSTFLKSGYGCSFEEIFTVRLDGNINRGDSGSWVIDPQNGNLYGHIVAGCPESRVGYMVPAYRIFNDIRRQLGGVVELAAIKKDSTSTASSASDPSPIDSKLEEGVLIPLGMNQDAEEVIKRFGMSETAFAEMAVETDRWYQSLIVNPSNLKPYIKKPTPYSWPDISDKAVYECIINICSNGSVETQEFWDKGILGQGDCPNWIAKWFLYRRFKLAKTSQQKRFSEAHPQDLDYMFVAPTQRLGNRYKVLQISSRPSDRTTWASSNNVPDALVERGKLYEDFSSSISVPEKDPLEKQV